MRLNLLVSGCRTGIPLRTSRTLTRSHSVRLFSAYGGMPNIGRGICSARNSFIGVSANFRSLVVKVFSYMCTTCIQSDLFQPLSSESDVIRIQFDADETPIEAASNNASRARSTEGIKNNAWNKGRMATTIYVAHGIIGCFRPWRFLQRTTETDG